MLCTGFFIHRLLFREVYRMDSTKPLPACPVRAPEWRYHLASELLPRAEREARSLGAVRPSDLTGLDNLNTPCWQVVRPTALDIPGNVTMLTGKGWCEETASLGAHMEFFLFLMIRRPPRSTLFPYTTLSPPGSGPTS